MLLPYDALAHFLNIKILKTADSSFNVHLYCLSLFVCLFVFFENLRHQ